MKSLLSTKTTRHPAVIDTLGGAPTWAPQAARTATTSPKTSKAPKASTAPKPPRAPKASRSPKGEQPRRPYLLRYAAALLLVAALLGWFLLRVYSRSGTAAPVATQGTEAEPTSMPALAITPPAITTEPVADPSACRTDQGDQETGAGVIAAFEHAYYVTRSGAGVRALATPDTSLPLADKIQAGIDSVAVGTTHCVRITPITAGVYSVVLAEMRPGIAPAQYPQTITTKDIDGRWFVDSIS
ncbi:hypothetical protein R4P64_30325 [Rhodococcus sp. IEGM 1366]|uniref:hypothetical protein n=1 Tax=Rhodococcus sp. IEGM 1366 TaxID=3082223 RepID=UPI002954A210|nr:hypothetical protein [Rhodococcus sp. IEGM 1366]MDV8070824.1 hypothetical protein [Rhodococcus sp. IEGM 1366]